MLWIKLFIWHSNSKIMNLSKWSGYALCRSRLSCFRGWCCCLCWLFFRLSCLWLDFFLLLFHGTLLLIKLFLFSRELFGAMISLTPLGAASHSNSLWVDCACNAVLCLYVKLWQSIFFLLLNRITIINTGVTDILSCRCFNHVLYLVPLNSLILQNYLTDYFPYTTLAMRALYWAASPWVHFAPSMIPTLHWHAFDD